MRIRTIKPDFWTDEKIGELSMPARLLFIALWNIADDYGNFANKPKQIKIQTMPYDNVDIQELLSELSSIDLITHYSSDNKEYYHLNNFLKHQKINRPSPPIYPVFCSDSVSNHGTITDTSVINHGTITDNSLGKEGRKGIEGKERKGNNNNNKFDFEICRDMFQENSLSESDALLFYNGMEKLQWLNQYGKPIVDKIRYTLQTIKQMKNENNERINKPEYGNFAHRSSRTNETELTRAEMRKLAKQRT